MVQNTVRSRPNSGRGTMTADRFRINLGKDAVKLALDGQWERAAEINRALLELCPDDCEAANRLAKALLELADYAGARTVLNNLRARYPNNNIARKNLARLEKLESSGAPRQTAAGNPVGPSPVFIAEGGKSCTTVLRRTGDAPAPDDVGAGDAVSLSIAGDSLIAETGDGRRLGAVEPRLARRLRKLMDGGNRYGAAVVGVSGAGVSIIIRETEQHPSLRNVVSFPPTGRSDVAAIQQDTDSLIYPESELAETELTDAPNAAIDQGIEADPEPEEILSELVTDEVDDDADAAASALDVPVLDADDVDDDPILEIVPPQEDDDWE